MEEVKVDETAAETPAETPVKRGRGRPKGSIGRKTKVANVVQAVWECGGHVYDVIKKLHTSPSHFYTKWRHEPEVEKAFMEAWKLGFERVTNILYDKCMEGDMKAMALYLKFNPVAKVCGWTDNQTITLKTEKPLTDEEKDALKKELFG